VERRVVSRKRVYGSMAVYGCMDVCMCMYAGLVCMYGSMVVDRWGGGVGRETGRSARAKKKKKCGRLQKITVVLCKGDDSVRL